MGGGGAKSYNGEKDWFSIIHSILWAGGRSSSFYPCAMIVLYCTLSLLMLDCNLLFGQTERCAPTLCTGSLCWTPAPSPSGHTTPGQISTTVSSLKGIVHVAHLMYDIGTLVRKITPTLIIMAKAKIN
jgi:hypothetical protein